MSTLNREETSHFPGEPARSNGEAASAPALRALTSSQPRAATPPPRNGLLPALARLWYATLWNPCYAASRALFRFRFRGKANVPLTGPVLLVSNHQSNLDPVLVGLACPRQLKYLARQGLFFWPFSWWIKALGAVPIDRDRGSIAGIRTTLRLLKDGEAVVVFPEGSRTFDGRVHEMLPGFCLLARRSGATLVPVGINGAYEALKRGTAIPHLAEISLVFGPPIFRAQYDSLSDTELVQLVTERIKDALRQTRTC
jgi:1-acyl-sn-glycerol-3-phosphate acyltransferase